MRHVFCVGAFKMRLFHAIPGMERVNSETETNQTQINELLTWKADPFVLFVGHERMFVYRIYVPL